MIGPFSGEYRWLSNFYPSPFVYGSARYPTAEHYYQAAKATTNEDWHRVMDTGNPGDAKRAGRAIVARAEWEQVKKQVMLAAVLAKFSQNPALGTMLVATGTQHLEEVNTWNDCYWGTVNGRGENWLGRILMMVRDVMA